MRHKKLLTYLLTLFVSITTAWAVLPALGDALGKGIMPENGGKYYIYADTYSGGAYVNRYLYINESGALALSTEADQNNMNYVWTCTVTNGKYTFQNVGNPAKYLAHKASADAAYNFTLGKADATHAGTTIWSDAASRYLVTKNDGSKFDQAQGTYNQSSADWCTDYVFVNYFEPSGKTITVNKNLTGAGSISVNGTESSLPLNKDAANLTYPVTLTGTPSSDIYKFVGFFNGDENLGTSYTIETEPAASLNIEARFELDIFSASFENGTPVQIYNTNNTSYDIKMNSQSDYAGKAVNSGTIAWGKNETWVLVGNASSFKMYSTTAGGNLALTLAGTGQNSAASLTANGSELCLTEVSANKFAISPVSNTAQSLNMHGGAGKDIKLYDTTDGNSKWFFRKIDLSKKATINYTTAFEGGKFVGNNKEIGYLQTVIGDVTINSTITERSTFSSGDCYFPANAVFSMSGDPLHGWTITINGGAGIAEQTIPAEGLTVDVNIAANPDDIYQYLYTTPDANGKPYRIPAIAAAPNGTIFAISDNRPCGNDIGYGEVDIKCRISNDGGATWGEEFFVANGQGGDSNVMTTGYGDAAIVADRVENKLLVMMVCGRTVCHYGRWHPDSTATSPNINRVARVYATYNESKKAWEWSQPEEVTNSIYSLFLKDGQPTVSSMFIGSGRIAQSSKIKVGKYYRLYCSMWTRDGGNRVIYSDDFGGSWNILGTVDSRPAPGGDEPKCEELPDGSVLLSSRKYNGRYFNVFKYTNAETAEGNWTGVVATNEVGDLAWGGNSTNGEALLVGNVLFQSAPTGDGRSDVSVFYKVLSDDASTYTPTALSSGWTEIEISHRSSAYSAMCILPDKENIGLLYEESPGSYCIVYRPLILKDLLTPEAYEALSAKQPQYASEKTPVWHSIAFNATGNILCDNGSGNRATTVAATESNATKWNIVGTKEQFYLISKKGNYLSYDAANNRYTTSKNKSERVALTIKENLKGSWEIMRKGASKSLCEVSVARSAAGEICDSEFCGAGNQLAFNDLTPVVYNPDIFSSENSPRWFKVQFKNQECFLTDKGDDANVLTARESDDATTQLWQFIGQPSNFYMKSKAGNYIYYTNSRFTASSTNKTELDLIENSAAGYYEIGRTTTANNMNQFGGAGEGKEIGEWTASDVNNPLRFVEEGAEVVDLTAKYFSTEEAPEYWWLQFNTGGAVLEDKGADALAKTAEKSYANSKVWQLIGEKGSFKMKSKAGNYLSWNNSRFTTTASSESAAELILHESSTTGCYEIQLKGGNYMNQHGGSGKDKELGVWDFGDTNNPINFISAEATLPTFSDEDNEYWYYIKFGNGGWTIDDKGAGNNVLTTALDDYDTQKWKVVGTKDNCQIISKAGHYLIYNSNIQASETPDAQGFKLVGTGNTSYPMHLEIQHNSVSGKAFNMNGGAGSGKSISLYDSNDNGNPLTFVAVEDVVFPEFTMAESNAVAPAEKLSLWYKQSAPSTDLSNTWMEYSLPIGNGQFGASLFGGVAKDQILFNEKTLWSGGPNNYGYYLPFGSIYIEDISGDFTFNPTKPVQNYYRDLNLKTATGTVTYESAEGVKFTRQYIASNPDNAIVTKITASQPGKLSFRISMESGKPTVDAETTYEGKYATFTGSLQTVSYNATMKVIAKGGYYSTGAEGITVEEADEVLIILAGSTDFKGNDATHKNGRAELLPADNKAIVDAVEKKGWDAVYADHVADHQHFFNRVELELEGVENNLPTNELIQAYNAASGTRNLMLEQLYYNYGRYLSIASSRGVDLPNNLQGIWNNTCTPPWHSDIHANINVQMNYWPVSAGNLNEMYEPFLNYIINEAAQPEWHTVASNAIKTLNDSIHTTTAVRDDAWTCLTENNIFGGISGFAPNYVIANAWYVTHMWQHYRYTLDNDYLRRAFPAMKGSSLFWADRMILAADGTYECPREYSPEHGPGSENGVAHAQQIVWESLDNTINAAIKLNAVANGLISQDDYNLLVNRRDNMDRGLHTEAYNGKWGDGFGITTGDTILREWKYTSTFEDNKGIERGHRHMSHLMALFPFSQLTPASPYFEPAINSMKLRGDESTGWSMGWKINLWARALMGDRSHAILRKALKHSTTYGTDQGQGGIYYNLFDSHAPFQIDGNFGAASGINEMLLQSHTEVIDILPALPSEWTKGSVKGLKAVGDFTVNIEWEGNQARKVTITNNQGQPLYVKCVGLKAAEVTVNGAAYSLGDEQTINGLPCYHIESAAGAVVEIDLTNAVQMNKSALQTLIKETEELISECENFYATEVALQTTDAEGAYYISTNADHNEHNTGTDGQGIAGLVDGSTDTFLHTNWNNDVTTITEAHRIDISLGEGNAVSSFMFKYATRKAQTDFPQEITIYGSNGDEYEQIAVINDNLPIGNSSESKWYTSSIINADKEYSKLRFVVTRTNSGNTAGGFLFFHMAEFDFMPRTAEPAYKYPEAVLLPAAIVEAKTEVAEAKEALNTTQTTIEYNASLAELQAAYDKILAAIESGANPVYFTTNEANPVLYKIFIKRTADVTVLKYDHTDSKVAIQNTADNNSWQAWYFTSDEDGVYVHPYNANGKVLGAASTNNSPGTVSAAEKGEQAFDSWKFVTRADGYYNIQARDGSNYFSNNGGVNNKMGFWSGDPAGDTGSLFKFVKATFDNDNARFYQLSDVKSTMTDGTNIYGGTSVGLYTGGTEYREAYTKAGEIVAAGSSTSNSDACYAAYTTLLDAKENLSYNKADESKVYYIKSAATNDNCNYCAGKYVHTINKSCSRTSQWGTATYNHKNLIFDDMESIDVAPLAMFQFEETGTQGEYKVKNLHSGLYIKSFSGTHLGTAEEASIVKVNGFADGQVTLNIDGKSPMHAQKDYGVIVSWSAAAGNASLWSIEEVASEDIVHPATMSTVGYSTLYLNYDVTIPEGCEAYYAEELTDGKYVKLEQINGVIPARTAVIIKSTEELTASKALNFIYAGNDAEAVESNMLDGVLYDSFVEVGNNHIHMLKKQNDVTAMYWVYAEYNSDGTIADGNAETDNGGYVKAAANKSYLVVPTSAGSALAYSFYFGGTTSIDEIKNIVSANGIYDLQGRKIEEITVPGYYVIDGKMVFVNEVK